MPKKQPMRVIAVAASKGGVGKSTLTAALAVRAAQDGRRVGLIDMDPQLAGTAAESTPTARSYLRTSIPAPKRSS